MSQKEGKELSSSLITKDDTETKVSEDLGYVQVKST
jgi:hypothetical protein